MDQKLSDFGTHLSAQEVGLFFFAGHGMQIDGENYLAAVDTNFDKESSLGLLPPAFVVIADNIQAQTDMFCLLDPIPTGSGPFFYRLGVK
jgi:hypothetical protein